MIDEFFNELDIKSSNASLNDNIFTILGIADLEVKHSNYLAYLFDSKINGKIGKKLLYDFLKKICVEKYLIDENGKKYKLNDLFDDTVNIDVLREESNIDLFINFSNFAAILIENKIWSKEHDNQLFRYSLNIKNRLQSNSGDKLLENNIIKNPICLYLTPDGREPFQAGSENWIPIGYNEIYYVIKKYCSSKTFDNLSEKQKMLLKDYLQLLKENIMSKEKENAKQILDLFFNDNSKKKVIEDIIHYVPNYKIREDIITKQCQKRDIEILAGSSSAWIYILPKKWKELYKQKNLGEQFVYFQVCNNASFSRCYLQCYFDFSTIQKEKNKIWASKFYQEFNGKKLSLNKDFSKDRSLGYTITILSKQDEYNKTEAEKQYIINNFFENFYDNPNIIKLYNFIKDFECI